MATPLRLCQILQYMTLLSLPQIRLAVIPSPLGRLPNGLRDMVAPGGWIAGIVLASLLVSWLTDQAWLAVAVGIAGMLLAAWRSVKILAATREALDRAERERSAMEKALRCSQKMEALGRLTVGVAHDFNNHLTVISSNVEMVARRLDQTQERLQRHTEAAMQGVQRAAVLTGRLLSFSHQPEPEPEAVDVERLLSGLSDLLRRTLGDRIGLDVVPPDAPWLIWADVNQMENALLSLSVNARDQVRDGAKLTIAVSNVRLHEVPRAAYPSMLPGDYIQIAVSDSTGSQPPKEWLPADDVSSADLSMARAFAREAGGYLLRSDPAAGRMSLRLFLPRYAPPALATAVSRRDTGGRPTILVVEDDAAVRGACVEILRELDYQVLQAPDAMEAFRLIADHGGIDLLFTDLGLPGGVSGRALADAARNVDAGIRVLFTTGYQRVDLTDRAGTALLRKPFNPAQLAAMVHDVLAAQPPVAQPPVSQPPVAQPPVAQPSVPRSEKVHG
jgi:signal transduction histidine kinase